MWKVSESDDDSIFAHFNSLATPLSGAYFKIADSDSTFSLCQIIR